MKSYFICIHCMLHLTPTFNFLYLYNTKSYNKYCNIVITAILLHYYNVSAIILQVYLHCAQKPIAYILYCNIAATLRINIFKTNIFTLLQYC